MGPVDLSIHLLSFFAPAFAVAVLVALAARMVLPRNTDRGRWWWPFLLNFLAGSIALVAGIVLFGRDGKMVTYAAMLISIASAQWVAGRAWRW